MEHLSPGRKRIQAAWELYERKRQETNGIISSLRLGNDVFDCLALEIAWRVSQANGIVDGRAEYFCLSLSRNFFDMLRKLGEAKKKGIDGHPLVRPLLRKFVSSEFSGRSGPEKKKINKRDGALNEAQRAVIDQLVASKNTFNNIARALAYEVRREAGIGSATRRLCLDLLTALRDVRAIIELTKSRHIYGHQEVKVIRKKFDTSEKRKIGLILDLIRRIRTDLEERREERPGLEMKSAEVAVRCAWIAARLPKMAK
jgi:hypothetical protein